MDKFLGKDKLPKQTEETENQNRHITERFKKVINFFFTKINPGLGSFTGDFHQMFKEKLTPKLH